jgi:quercetin dioxygenase-like cupin family protein
MDPEHDTTVMKVDSRFSPAGNLPGEKYLALGKKLGMRRFELNAGNADGPHSRPYETVGTVLKGCAELTVEGNTTQLREGDSFVVPLNAKHSWRITEGPFESVEATAPPAVMHDRDRGHTDPTSASASSTMAGKA